MNTNESQFEAEAVLFLNSPVEMRTWFETLRHHKPSQLCRRGWIRLKRIGIGPRAAQAYRRRARSEVTGLRDGLDLAELSAYQRRDCWARWDKDRARTLASGLFTFAGQTRHLPTPVDWNLATWPDAPAWWKFQLHSFEFLSALLTAAEDSGPSDYRNTAWSLVKDWVTHNPLGKTGWEQGAWHPYCISRRVLPWLLLAADDGFVTARACQLIESLAAQMLFLEDNVERDLGGNHLLANLKALLVGAACLRGAGPERWLRRAWPELLRQLDAQILPSGEHFERTPTYHAIVLEDLLDVTSLARQAFANRGSALRPAIDAMTQYLAAILHPDGQIPLLGDSAFDATPDPAVLLDRARCWLARPDTSTCTVGQTPQDRDRESSTRVLRVAKWTRREICALGGWGRVFEPPAFHLKQRSGGSKTRPQPPDPVSMVSSASLLSAESGPARRIGDYWVYRDNEQFLIFDAGSVAADHLPAHGHADLLTLEASVGRQRLFVDSGTCCYEPGPMRNYCRSTAAHNTLQVDQAEQCDTWSSFRMGYRGHPTSFCTGQRDGIVWAQASHNAYRRHGVPRVTRWIAVDTGQGLWACIDVADSRGTHQLHERLHLHPDVAAEFISSRLVRLCCADRILWLSLLGGPTGACLKQGWYCPRFGEPERNTVVEWSLTAKGQGTLGWALWFSANPGTARIARWNRKIRVQWGGADGDSQQFALSDLGHGDIA